PINGHFVLNRSQVSVHIAQAPFRQLLPPLKYGESHLRSEEHTSELQSHLNLVCRLLLEKRRAHVCTPITIESRMHSYASRQKDLRATLCAVRRVHERPPRSPLHSHTPFFFFFLKNTRPTASHTCPSHAVFRF